jgi:hypothetical protein
MFTASLGGHQKLLINNLGWKRLLRHEHELEVVSDAIDHREVHEESNDLHLCAGLGTEQKIHFIHPADHLGPAAARDRGAFLLYDQLIPPFL